MVRGLDFDSNSNGCISSVIMLTTFKIDMNNTVAIAIEMCSIQIFGTFPIDLNGHFNIASPAETHCIFYIDV